VWSSLDELAGLWAAAAVFEPQLPVELTDAVHEVWRRAVEKSRGWADPERNE
jgi:glycerol kinase